ncbi:hypothetical protein [Lentibacillus salinarum]|uniref:Uncharacterized protein n=1 Tax=Lentibacillus salinarum TaxID=446820 RepID=A0ABW3ZXC8_9BACI
MQNLAIDMAVLVCVPPLIKGTKAKYSGVLKKEKHFSYGDASLLKLSLSSTAHPKTRIAQAQTESDINWQLSGASSTGEP